MYQLAAGPPTMISSTQTSDAAGFSSKRRAARWYVPGVTSNIPLISRQPTRNHNVESEWLSNFRNKMGLDQLPLQRGREGKLVMAGYGPCSIRIDYAKVLARETEGVTFRGYVDGVDGRLIKQVCTIKCCESSACGSSVYCYFVCCCAINKIEAVQYQAHCVDRVLFGTMRTWLSQQQIPAATNTCCMVWRGQDAAWRLLE